MRRAVRCLPAAPARHHPLLAPTGAPTAVPRPAVLPLLPAVTLPPTLTASPSRTSTATSPAGSTQTPHLPHQVPLATCSDMDYCAWCDRRRGQELLFGWALAYLCYPISAHCFNANALLHGNDFCAGNGQAVALTPSGQSTSGQIRTANPSAAAASTAAAPTVSVPTAPIGALGAPTPQPASTTAAKAAAAGSAPAQTNTSPAGTTQTSTSGASASAPWRGYMPQHCFNRRQSWGLCRFNHWDSAASATVFIDLVSFTHSKLHSFRMTLCRKRPG